MKIVTIPSLFPITTLIGSMTIRGETQTGDWVLVALPFDVHKKKIPVEHLSWAVHSKELPNAAISFPELKLQAEATVFAISLEIKRPVDTLELAIVDWRSSTEQGSWMKIESFEWQASNPELCLRSSGMLVESDWK